MKTFHWRYQANLSYPTEDAALNALATSEYRRAFEDANYQFATQCADNHLVVVRPLAVEGIEIAVGHGDLTHVTIYFTAQVRHS